MYNEPNFQNSRPETTWDAIKMNLPTNQSICTILSVILNYPVYTTILFVNEYFTVLIYFVRNSEKKPQKPTNNSEY